MVRLTRRGADAKDYKLTKAGKEVLQNGGGGGGSDYTAADNTVVVNNTNHTIKGNYQAGEGIHISGPTISSPIQSGRKILIIDDTINFVGDIKTIYFTTTKIGIGAVGEEVDLMKNTIGPTGYDTGDNITTTDDFILSITDMLVDSSTGMIKTEIQEVPSTV